MTILIPILVALLIAVLLFTLNNRLARLSPATRQAVLIGAAIISAVPLGFELFIYIDRRIEEFREAVSGIPGWVVVAVFLLITYLVYRLYGLVTRLNQKEMGRFIRENVSPHVRDMVRDVRQASGGGGWKFWRKKPQSPPDGEDRGKSH